MARLNWNNIAAPDFSAAANMYSSASQNWDRAASSIGDALSGFGDIQKQKATAAALPILAKVANEQGVDAAIDQVMGTVAPHNMSPELMNAVAGLRKQSLGYETTRRTNKVALDQNQRSWNEDGRTQQTHDRKIMREDQAAALAPELLRRDTLARQGQIPFREVVPDILPGESGGDFDALFNQAQRDGGAFAGVKPTNMTIDEAIAFTDPNGAYAQYVAKNNGGVVSTPLGGLQIIGTNLRDAKKELGLRGDEKFSTDMQMRIGEWLYGKQGAGAWVGYRAGSGSGKALADLLPENNMLSPETLLGYNEGLYDSWRTGVDNNRADTKIANEETAEALAQEAIRSAPRQVDISSWVAENSPNAQVTKMALDALKGYNAEELRQLPMNFVPGAGENSESFRTAVASTQDAQNMEAANSPLLRIKSNVESVYSDGDPALKLAEALGQDVNQSVGTNLKEISRIAERAGVSPAVAAAAAQETAKKRSLASGLVRWALPGEAGFNTPVIDVDAAIELAKQYRDPANIQAMSEMDSQIQHRNAALETLEARAAAISQDIAYAEAYPDRVDSTAVEKLKAEREAIYQHVLSGNFEKERPLVTTWAPEKQAGEEASAPATAGAAAGLANGKRGGGWNSKPNPVAADASTPPGTPNALETNVAEAVEYIGALYAKTPEQLENLSDEEAGKMIDDLTRKLKNSFNSPERQQKIRNAIAVLSRI